MCRETFSVLELCGHPNFRCGVRFVEEAYRRCRFRKAGIGAATSSVVFGDEEPTKLINVDGPSARPRSPANRSTASTLKHQPNIAKRVEQIVRQRSDIAEKAQAIAVERVIEKRALSIEYVINTLMDNVEMCMARKTIPTKVFLKSTETVVQVDITKHDPAGATAALTLLGRHMGMFTDKLQPKPDDDKPDFDDPAVKLQLARDILFMIASAEHEMKNAPKTIEHVSSASKLPD
jgi:hypothetical protein